MWGLVGWSVVACSVLTNYDLPALSGPDASVDSPVDSQVPIADTQAPIPDAPPSEDVIVPDASPPTCTATPCVVEVAASAQTTCARLADGSVYCWGSNQTGSVGGNVPQNYASPSKVTFDGPVDRIGMGGWPREDSVACGRRGSLVECWGTDGVDRLLGRGGDASAGTFIPIPAPVQGADAATDEIAIGGQLACVRNGSTVSCWGTGYDGVKRSSAVPMATPRPVKQIVGGRTSHCVVLDTDEVACAGYQQFFNPLWNDASFGNGPGSVDFQIVQGVTGIRQLSTQGNHICALKTSGAVLCWGRNTRGELGRGTTSTFDNVPAVVNLPQAAKWLGTATNHSCAVLADDTVWCWGRNGTRTGNYDGQTVARGQCGAPEGDAALDKITSKPRRITGLPAGPVRTVVGGYEHSCALMESGELYCWGSNRKGQLGRGKTDGGGVDDLPHPVAARVVF